MDSTIRDELVKEITGRIETVYDEFMSSHDEKCIVRIEPSLDRMLRLHIASITPRFIEPPEHGFLPLLAWAHSRTGEPIELRSDPRVESIEAQAWREYVPYKGDGLMETVVDRRNWTPEQEKASAQFHDSLLNADEDGGFTVDSDVATEYVSALRDTIKITTNNCQRCGGEHVGIEFQPLHYPVGEWNHYGICPTTGQPLLMRIGD
ncbi:hypothetical protein [Alicyclobacillus sp. ALC3]|uniref:hypothetical protein n=1 Tax=Alicyclobacillus sp. ALC3 TaxID=2796143 RepID=UPI0023795A2D|nr:hypothetical protein [Alicyclobacillus sp. ALC3]WDL96931.1 hypothetical protein JC200_22075 [Alicyclobacillus sp. ALC3]